MHSSILLFLLVIASLGLADDCGRAVSACVSNINLNNLCPTNATMFPDPCGCSKASQVVQCYSSLCPGQTEVYFANSAYTEVCSGTTVYAPGGFNPSSIVSNIISSSAAAPAAGTTGTDTPATATAAVTETGSATMGEVTPAPTGGSGSGSGSGSSGSGAGGSAGPGSTSKAGSERSFILPGGGVMAAVLGLAILL